ncbi:MAG TPA: DUF6340 family protein [Saprospiraceae bacterium]|nr:DUF6340 family protein [Saprospiraceae bacterium]HMP13624.1 DUF6340 family protein [Saprospiraceae bacterium]
MKTNKTYLFALLCTLLLWQACSPTMQLDVLQPAQMVVPEHIQTIATLDRSKPEKGFLSFLEGAITGEEIGQDRTGRRHALDGLMQSLTRTPRFNVKHTGIELTGSRGGGSFTGPLEWAQVEQICRDYAADALVTIEMFDSDNRISYAERREKSKDKEGNEITKILHDARLDMSVRIGWRFYDPKTRIIQDEFTTLQQAQDSRSADTRERALQQLRSQTTITRKVSFDAGAQYGMRIAPVWVRVNRTFYDSGKGSASEQMKQAARFAKADQWERAAEIWRSLVRTAPDNKTAGRAAYNMAVANEHNGLLESALEWAQRAYTDFGNKKARQYISTLQIRLSDQRRLREQMRTKAVP